jgi:quercetin dioxygenase-like cupin family protein
VTVIPPGGGEIVGDTLSRYGPGREGADLHVHRRHSDLFYVLEGELTVRLGPEDRLVTVPAGSVARVPPGVVHGFRNATGAQLRYLNFHVPGQRFADYLRGIRDGVPFSYDQFDPPADGGVPASEAAIGERVVAIEALALEERWGEADEAIHVHDDHVESLYVLEGEAVLTLGEDARPAPAGAWAQIPRGVPHALAFPRRTRYLSLRSPQPQVET